MTRIRRPMRLLRIHTLPVCARLLTVLAAFLVLLWITGNTLTDRYQWSQYLWWVPSQIILILTWPLLLLAWIFQRFSLRLAALQLRVLTSAALLLITLFSLFQSWHIHRFLTKPDPGNFRVLYWNLAVDPQADKAPAIIQNQTPDLAIIANPRWDEFRTPLLESLGSMVSNPNARSPQTHLLFRDEIIVASRDPLVSYAQVHFDMGSNEPEDRGVILAVQLQTRSNQTLTVWIVDMPSNPLRSRMQAATRAQSAIRTWSGPLFTLDEINHWQPTQNDDPFPKPHIIVGDFNAPRHSHSINRITANLTESFSAAGRGIGATWPRSNPLIAIDLLFTNLPVASSRVINPETGRHRIIVVDLNAP